jgi:predicted phosphodiesterase
MSNLFKQVLLVLLLFVLTSPLVYSAELILTPQGVLLRALEFWDGYGGRLMLSHDRDTEILYPSHGRIEKWFKWRDFCNTRSYLEQDAQFNGKKVVDLSRLCNTEDTDGLQFAFISDTQNSNRAHFRTAQFLGKLIQNNPAIKFVVHGGDFVQFSFEELWQKYRAVATTNYSHQIPILPVHGNHEYYFDPGSSFFKELYSTESTKRGYYVVEFERLAIIVLNSNLDELTEPERINQNRWLEDQLATFAGKKWTAVAFHHPGYSSATTCIPLPRNPEYVEDHWLPLFVEYGVSLILNGHNHLYERLHFDGIEQVNAGPAGGGLCLLKDADVYAKKIASDKRTVTLFQFFTWGELEIITYDIESGQVIDRIVRELPKLARDADSTLDVAHQLVHSPSIQLH